jgi:hypothetical protein
VDVEDAIERAWRELLDERWEEDKAHQAFLTLCASTDRLAEAGRRYREVRERNPARAERAKKEIDRTLVRAMQNLSALETEPARQNTKLRMFLVALGMSGAFVASFLWALLRFL